MPVRIDQINIETAGPISDLQLSLGPFNLIYGHNERGKTFLVEFVIRSLFKNLSDWSLRNADSRGKVVVSGLSKSPLSLMPSSSRKLEDYLAETEPGMPAQISRLLVVKGAELSFEDGQRSGISKDVLKEFLSGQGVLDNVQARISKTIQGASVENGQISGHSRGELRTRNSLSDNLTRFDNLFGQIEAIYSGGERQALEARVQQIEGAIEQQEIARRHQAYQIDQKIQQQQKLLGRLPQDELDRLDDDFKKLQEAQRRIGRQQDKLAELEQRSEHYRWLDEAISVYETRAGQGKAKTSLVYPLTIGFLLLLAIVFSFVGLSLVTFILILVAAVAGWFYIRQYRSALDNATDIEEIKKLEAEYQERFGRSLSGLPQMKEQRKSMEQAYHGSKTLAEELESEQENLAGLQDEIAARLQRLTGKTTDPNNWEAEIEKLIRLRQQIQDQITQYQMELVALDLFPSDYHSEPAAVEYDRNELQAYRQEFQEVQEELKQKEDEIASLKQQISSETGDAISVDWEILIQNLQRKREETSAEYRTVTARVLGGILVNGQLDIIRAQEEEKIQDKLASPTISEPIFHTTRRYSGVRYEGGRVWLTDDFGQFALGDLSTGAREQVLLGLRLGFASQILGKDRLFLLLDDAFQHADWQRRERLLDQAINLAKGGWQIVYFTMDDHIRDLFDAAGQAHFPGQYRYHELGA